MTQELLKQGNAAFKHWEQLQLALDEVQRLKNCYGGSICMTIAAGGVNCRFYLDGTAATATLDNIYTCLAVAANDARQDFAAL